MPLDSTDEGLMLRYQKGDVRAFDELLARHRRPVFNFLLRSTRDRAKAEDLLQEVFLRVIKSAGMYKQKAKFTTWLYTIARNLCVDNSRRQKHRNHRSLDAPLKTGEDGGVTLGDMVSDDGPATDRKVMGNELRGRMEDAIAKLSEEQREVFLMREVLGMPFKEIAEVVGVSENTIKSRMRYALEKLREDLKEYADLAKALA